MRKLIAVLAAALLAGGIIAAPVSAATTSAAVTSGSAAALGRAEAALAARLRIPGTAFVADPATDQVLVTADSTVTGAERDAVEAIVASLGGVARLETVSGVLRTTISGGDRIIAGSSGCSLGFNVRGGGADYFLTAGHCTAGTSTWTNGSVTLGTTAGTSFPGDDYGIVRYTNTSVVKEGTVGSQDITSAAMPGVNQPVTTRGSTTGIRSGRVTGLNATVNYPEGTVSGLIATNICGEQGDSGGPLYFNTVALGLASGGAGNCTTGGTTYFQPIVEALNRYGVSVF